MTSINRIDTENQTIGTRNSTTAKQNGVVVKAEEQAAAPQKPHRIV